MSASEEELIIGFGTTCYYVAFRLIITTLGYGLAVLGTLVAIRLLEIKSFREPKSIQLLCCIVILFCFSGFIILQIIASFIKISEGIAVTPDPGIGIIVTDDIQLFLNAVVIMVGDFVICWRAWVLLQENKFWRVILVIFMAINIGVNVADPIYDVINLDAELRGVFDILDWLTVACSLAVNMLATSLIGWKAWSYYREMHAASIWKDKQAQVQRVLLLIVESGALFLAIQLFALITESAADFAKGTFDTNLTFVIVAKVAGSLWDVCSALYPIAIIILIHSNHSPIEETYRYSNSNSRLTTAVASKKHSRMRTGMGSSATVIMEPQ